jgi:hypothetical protein
VVYNLRPLTIGNQTVYNVPCFVGDNDDLPLLSQSGLLKFHTWSVDNDQKRLAAVGLGPSR